LPLIHLKIAWGGEGGGNLRGRKGFFPGKKEGGVGLEESEKKGRLERLAKKWQRLGKRVLRMKRKKRSENKKGWNFGARGEKGGACYKGFGENGGEPEGVRRGGNLWMELDVKERAHGKGCQLFYQLRDLNIL